MSGAANLVWYRLSPVGDGRGISCDERGAFVGPIALLARVRDTLGREMWAPRPITELNAALSACYGLPVDLTAKVDGLAAIARALSKDEIAVAQIATLHLQLPDLPALAKATRPGATEARLAGLLHRSGILKSAAFDPDKHPRWPADSPDSQGGQFRPADADADPEEPSGNEASPIIPAQEVIIRPAPLPWDIPYRIPAPPTEIAPYLDLPNGAQRESIPQNPYPDRPECAEEWNFAAKPCQKLKDRGLLGKGDYRNFGKNMWQCVTGVVSEDCGGRSTGA